MKKFIIACLLIFFFMSCKKKEPDTPTNQCVILEPEKLCFQFVDEVEKLGMNVDSSVYLNKVVGKWKIHCGRVVPIKQFCNRYSELDNTNYSINFKSDFTFEYNTDTIHEQGVLQNLKKGYTNSSPYSFFFDKVTNNKLGLFIYPSPYNEVYMTKL